MLIEFVGVPGAGKSTLAAHLQRRLAAAGTPADRVNLIGYYRVDGTPMSRGQIRLDRALGLAHRPRLAWATMSCYLDEGTGKGMSWMVNLCRRNRAAGKLRRRGGTVILEEGPLSALCLAAAWRQEGWSAAELLPSLHLPDAVILLYADPGTTCDRLAGRGGVLSEDPREKVMELLERYRKAWAVLAPRIPIPIWRYDTTHAQPASVARRIVADLRGGSGGESHG